MENQPKGGKSMNKKILSVAIGLAFFLMLTSFLANQETVSAQECRLVRLHGGIGANVSEIRIEPRTLWISKGTCVIWSNWVRTDEVKVVFEEGKKCEDVTDAPAGFTLDTDTCYVTDWISLGGTSSLKFNEAGTYKYVVEAAGGTIKSRGEISVR
jgi:hypothetical protein